MTRFEAQFNNMNNETLTLSRLIIYQNTDNQLEQATETVHFLDNQPHDIDKSSYFFTTRLLSDIINQLELKPKGRILTNIFSVALGLSARYNNEVVSYVSNVFPRVKAMGDNSSRFNIKFVPQMNNMDQLWHLLSEANVGDSVIFIADLF